MNNPGGDAATKAAMVAAIREYELSRDRYFHTLRVDAEEKIVRSVATRRDKLTAEIENLRVLAKVRGDARTVALDEYARRCPGRVTATTLLPPTVGERIGGSEKLFKVAVKAAEDYKEVSDILKRRRDELDGIEREMRAAMHKHHADLIRFLEAPGGLENAFKRDPLLARAHAQMKAAVANYEALAHAGAGPADRPAP